MGSSPSSSAIVSSSIITSNSKINSTSNEGKGQQQQQQILPRSHFSKRVVNAPSQPQQSEELSNEERDNKDNNINNIESFHCEKSIQSEMLLFHDTEKDIKIHGGHNNSKNYNSNRILPKNLNANTTRNHYDTKNVEHNNACSQSQAQKRGSFQSIEFQHQPNKINTNININTLNNGNTMTDSNNNNNHNYPGSPVGMGMGENRLSFRLTLEQQQQQQQQVADHFDSKTHNKNNTNCNYKESSVAVSQHNGDISKIQPPPTNLFENEADQLFKTHGSSIDGEARNSKKNTNIINSSNTPQQSQQQQPLSEEILIQLLTHQRTTANSNTLGVIQESGDSSAISSANSPNGKQIFKSEIIQASKSKTNKDTFKKGNILLTVQEDTANAIQQQLKKSAQNNFIAELVDNKINITDFLLSEKEDIQHKIVVQKQKLKQSKLQAQQEGDQAKINKNKRNHYGKTQTSDDGSSSQLGSSAQSQSSLTSFGSTTSCPNPQTQAESNIMISYCQDWETMRKTGFKTQTISTIS